MQALSAEQLTSIAHARGVTYETLPSANPLTIATRMSREFPLSREFAYTAFADPATHVRLFSIIRGSSTIPKEGIAKIVPPNQFYVLEHVEEQAVTPRLMFIRYTLNPPDTIIKEGVPDPFGDLDDIDPLADKKKARVIMRFAERGANRTLVTIESEFQASTGAVFMRGMIDHVWLNFFENLMIETRELSLAERMTQP
jgi:hypothetical protein